VSLSLFALVNIVLFQNCQQQSGLQLSFQEPQLSSIVSNKVDNTFVILNEKDSYKLKLSPVDEEKLVPPDFVFSEYSLADKNHSQTLNGNIESLDKTTGEIIYSTAKNFTGVDDFKIKKVFKLETAAEIKNAKKGEDGKYYLSFDVVIPVKLIIHDHAIQYFFSDVNRNYEDFQSIKTNANGEASGNVAGAEEESIFPLALDKTPPQKPLTFNDGDYPKRENYTPMCSWTDGSEIGTGIDFYELAVGSTPGGEDVISWTNVGFVLEAQLSTLDNPNSKAPFKLGGVYYTSIRAVDFAGHKSEILKGDGWVYEPFFKPMDLKFTNLKDVPLSQKITSEKVVLKGVGEIEVKASCKGCLVSVNGGEFKESVDKVKLGDSLVLQMTSSNTYETTLSASVQIGDRVSSIWQVATMLDPYFYPSAIQFKNQVGILVGQKIISEAVVLKGKGDLPVRATCQNCMISKNDATFAPTVEGVKNGDSLKIQVMSSDKINTSVEGILQVGKVTAQTWQVSTSTNASSFTIETLVEADLNAKVTSIKKITGSNGPLPISITGDGSPQISLDGGATWASSGSIKPDQSVTLRMSASGSKATAQQAQLTVGGVSANWNVISKLNIENLTGVIPNTVVNSSDVTISNLKDNLELSVSGGGAPAISIAGGAWNSSGTLSPGQSFKLRITSSASSSSAQVASLKINAVGSTLAGTVNWSVTPKDWFPSGAYIGRWMHDWGNCNGDDRRPHPNTSQPYGSGGTYDAPICQTGKMKCTVDNSNGCIIGEGPCYCL
jgi:hypothetical protein